MATFKAIVIRKTDAGQNIGLEDFDAQDLMDGDVTVRPQWSTVNYKDGLAITGKAPVVRRFPMIPGIDFAGTVEASTHPDWKPGDKVILNGWGLGETHLGAYAQTARVKGDWLVPLPASMSTRDAMAIGTAGYTAMLAVMALEHQGLRPTSGPVVVTGAAGGVGSVAVAILAKLGFQVTASTGRPQEADYLRRLGATEIIDRKDLAGAPRPLNKERFAGGIDVVGSTTLANVLSMIRYQGAVTACGLAGGMDLPATVAPFILRGGSLLGIDSVMRPLKDRRAAWGRLEADLDRAKLSEMTNEIGLAAVVRLVVPDAEVVKPRGDQAIIRHRPQFIAGQLLADEAVERFVGVETADHVIAIAPGIRLVAVALVAVGLGVAHQVEPVPTPFFAVVRGVQQAVDQALVGIRGGVVQEGIDLRRGGRNAQEIEIGPAHVALRVEPFG